MWATQVIAEPLLAAQTRAGWVAPTSRAMTVIFGFGRFIRADIVAARTGMGRMRIRGILFLGMAGFALAASSAAAADVPAAVQPGDADYCQWISAINSNPPKFFCARAGGTFQVRGQTPDSATIAAAEAGDGDALLKMGNAAFFSGAAETGAEYVGKAAAKNQRAAMCEMGDLNRNGIGVAKNPAEAMRWYGAAQDAGFVTATAQLASMYASGDAGAVDDAKATELFRKAAEAGDLMAMQTTGVRYSSGKGVTKDTAEALVFYRMAYARGDMTFSTEMIARIYDTGDGVPEDPAQAFHWYRLAAEYGVPHAMSKLAGMYHDGRGVEKDPEQEAFWQKQALLHVPAVTVAAPKI